MKSKRNAILSLITVLGIVILANILSQKYFLRLDFTQDKRYTLSRATKNILKDLDETVTITVYFSEGLPPQIDKIRKDLKEMLIEYSQRSGGNIVYEFKNPNENEEIEQEAMANGIRPTLINVREKDQAVQKKAYLGAVMHYGKDKEVIPAIISGAGMEYNLTMTLKKLIVTDKPLIGLIQGHGEPTESELSQLKENINILYKLQTVNITDSTNLFKFKALILLRPQDTIPDSQLEYLDTYLQGGGKLFMAFDRVAANFEQGTGIEMGTGLEKWIQKYGVTVPASFITDANCGNISVLTQQGYMQFQQQIQFPYFPIFVNFAKNDITNGLETMVMEFASPIYFMGDTTIKYIPLVFGSEFCNTTPSPVYFDVQKKWSKNDFNQSSITTAAYIEKKFSANSTGKIVIVTDGDSFVNGNGQQRKSVQTDNVNFAVNSIDFMCDDTGLVQLRTKGATSRFIKELDDSKKNLIKWGNFLIPIIMIVLYGIFRTQMNKRIRRKRKEENYA